MEQNFIFHFLLKTFQLGNLFFQFLAAGLVRNFKINEVRPDFRTRVSEALDTNQLFLVRGEQNKRFAVFRAKLPTVESGSLFQRHDSVGGKHFCLMSDIFTIVAERLVAGLTEEHRLVYLKSSKVKQYETENILLKILPETFIR